MYGICNFSSLSIMMFVQVVDLKQGEDLSVDFKAIRVAFRYVQLCMVWYTHVIIHILQFLLITTVQDDY